MEAGKRLAVHNHRKREELKAQSEISQYYEVGAVGVIGGLGYYLYQAKKEVNVVPPPQQPAHPHPQTNKFEME